MIHLILSNLGQKGTKFGHLGIFIGFGFILMASRVPQLKMDFHGSGDGSKASQNYPLRLGPGSFGSKLMDLDGLKVSNFQPKI